MKEEGRVAILEATEQVMVEQGLRVARMEDIPHTRHITKGRTE
ncbi:hypothetical protein [Archangium sp.]|nr:hypothetical protein [Archangium sp.]HYO54520.1 hypothetical protein [Archangium sp.]